MADFAATFKSTASIAHTLPVGANRVTAASVPYSPADLSRVYSSDTASGTGAGGSLRYLQKSRSLVATTVDIDLATAVCSDGTTGLVNWRECRIVNQSITDVLTVGLGATPFTIRILGGTTPTRVLQPGESLVASKPYGAAGHVVTGANVVRLDAGAATVAYSVLFSGN